MFLQQQEDDDILLDFSVEVICVLVNILAQHVSVTLFTITAAVLKRPISTDWKFHWQYQWNFNTRKWYKSAKSLEIIWCFHADLISDQLNFELVLFPQNEIVFFNVNPNINIISCSTCFLVSNFRSKDTGTSRMKLSLQMKWNLQTT